MVGTLELFVGEVFKELPPLVARRLEDVRIHQAQDGVCSAVMTYCMKGWPDKNKVPLQITPFWKERDRLSIYDGIVLLDRRLVIPSALRQDILALLHERHQEVRRCQERARESVWWPNCNMHVEHMVTQCAICAETRVQRSEPLLPTVTPDRPWQHLGIDLFQLKGRDYVLIVDYYSRFPEVVSVGSTTAPAVISAIKSCIARFGIPDIVRADNGPQFVSNEFAEFARSYGFRHETSSPRYPQSNGEAERTVRTMKDLLFKGPDPYLALLSYRDTPGPNGISPAQALMGRKLQTRLPKLPEQMVPSLPCHTSFREMDSSNKARQAMNYNRRHASSQLAPLSPGDYVWVTDTRCSGEVLSQAQRPRSYLVQTPRGVLQRNRRHLVLHSSEVTPAQLAASPPVTPEIMQPAAPREDPTQTEVTPQETLTQTRSGRIVRPPRRLGL
ncbi:uncharacterized protein K02A2.6-like [Dermacentor silvarum]|uniref:uncharacterized protein K02A2.6-like n=1 Tax=Dermacentor silvarum TaxID=543639 RepID=UPI00210093F6|nr:uncharacterized protein K02A2.6-like [Dermacentor silvarum]